MAHSGFELSKLTVYDCSLYNDGIVNLNGGTHNGTDGSSSDTIPSADRLAQTSDTTGKRFRTPP